MRRLFGMMPQSEIKREEQFKDKDGLKVIIQAGPNGWTIIWADGGSTYKDIESSTDENFNTAYKEVVDSLGEITPIKKYPNGEM